MIKINNKIFNSIIKDVKSLEDQIALIENGIIDTEYFLVKVMDKAVKNLYFKLFFKNSTTKGLAFVYTEADIMVVSKNKVIKFNDLIFSKDNSISLWDIVNQNSNMSIEKEEIDYSILPENFTVTMYTGGTGTGKTYKAITENNNFVIAVPTRQLAYEVLLDYKQKIQNIATGEISLTNQDNKSNTVVVYESLNKDLIDKYSCLIIDEAHYIADEDRGGNLIEKIIYAIKNGKKVFFLTATDTISDSLKKLLHINVIDLKPFKEVEKIKVNNIKELTKIIHEEGKKCLIFTKYRPDEFSIQQYASLLKLDESDFDYISADVPTSERLQKQIDFRNGKIKVMISTNVLAQGVNFPADVVIVEYNEWDEWEIIQQKIGRAGRPQFADKAYYYLQAAPPSKHNKGVQKAMVKRINLFYKNIFIYSWGFQSHEIPSNLHEYRSFKYSRGFLRKLANEGLAGEQEVDALRFLDNEESKILRIIEDF